MRCAEWATRDACTAAGTDWWLCWWHWALLRAVCVLTACLHASRSSLDLDRAFISKWMTLNWPGKYTGCLLIIGRDFFFSASACTSTQTHKYTKSIHSRTQKTRKEACFSSGTADNNCHVIKTDRQFKALLCQVQKQGFGCQQRLLTKNSGTYSLSSIYTSFYLPLPPTTYFHSFNPL